MSKSLFEVRHPFFRPFYRRAVFTGAILAWTVYEWVRGAEVWAVVFGVAGIYLFIQFFLKFDAKDYEKPPE